MYSIHTSWYRNKALFNTGAKLAGAFYKIMAEEAAIPEINRPLLEVAARSGFIFLRGGEPLGE